MRYINGSKRESSLLLTSGVDNGLQNTINPIDKQIDKSGLRSRYTSLASLPTRIYYSVWGPGALVT